MITTILRNVLINNANLTPIVGSRIYAFNIPQGDSYPAIAIEDNERESLSAFEDNVPVYFRHEISINCYSEKAQEVNEMLKYVRNQISDWINRDGESVKIRGNSFLDESITFEDVEDKGKTGVYIGKHRRSFIYNQAIGG